MHCCKVIIAWAVSLSPETGKTLSNHIEKMEQVSYLIMISPPNKNHSQKELYFPLGKMARDESIFQDPDQGTFSPKYKPIFSPIIGKQLALNTFYQNDLLAPANTRITIDLLKTFDRLKINFKVNVEDITEEEINHALFAAMGEIIKNKQTFLKNHQIEDIPSIQGEVHRFLNTALTTINTQSFQSHFGHLQGYLEFANSVITSKEDYVTTVSALKKMIVNEQAVFHLKRDDVGETMKHSMRTAWISLILASELDDFDDKKDYETLGILCLAHDCGKALIPNEIIYKKGRLTQIEKDIMKSHVLLSFILSSDNQQNLSFESFAMAMHHIKENRQLPHSYGILPDTYTSFHDYLTPEAQKKLHEIRDETTKYYRVMSIADTFEAITAERVYKKPSSIGKTIEIMLNENRTGEQFHPPYLDALTQFVVRHFLPKNMIFKLTEEILDTCYSGNDFNGMDRKYYQKNHKGVVVGLSHHLDDPVACVIFNRHTKKVERNLDIQPLLLLNQRFFT